MATFERIVRELAKLKAITRPRSQDGIDMEVQYAAMANGLNDFSDAVIADACKAWGQESQWFPTLAELRGVCVKFDREHRPAHGELPPVKREAMTDMRWWYAQCEKRADPVTWNRARELYPQMFYSDGALVPRHEMNFYDDARNPVPFYRSKAYGDSKEMMDGDFGVVIRRLAKQANADDQDLEAAIG